MDIDLEELAAIIELLDQTEFTHFRFEKGDLRIAVSRDGLPLDGVAPLPAPAAPAAQPAVPTAVPTAAGTRPAPTTPAARSTPEVPVGALDESTLAADEVVVRAPMLGTFYRSPKPGEPPYVEVGSRVSADSVVAIVEVMKLMNSVVAEVEGEVTRVLVADSALVEFGQPLFVVRQTS